MRKSIWAQKELLATVYWNLIYIQIIFLSDIFRWRLSVKLQWYLQMSKISFAFSLEAESNLAIFASSQKTEICEETNKYVNKITLTL